MSTLTSHRMLIALCLSAAFAIAQPPEHDREKGRPGGRQVRQQESGQTPAQAQPERSRRVDAASGQGQMQRNVGKPPESNPAGQPQRNPGGFDRNANRQPGVERQPGMNTGQPQRNPGGFDRNANRQPGVERQPGMNTGQPQRNPGGFDRNANRQPGVERQPGMNTGQPQRNPGGFDRNANRQPGVERQPGMNTGQPQRNPGGFDRNANRQPGVERQPGMNTGQPQRNPGGFDRNANRQPGINANQPRQSGPNDRFAAQPRAPRATITRNQQGRIETYRGRTGSEVRYQPDGRVGLVRRGGTTIQRGAGDSRRIVVHRPDRSMIVTNHRGHGFVQRPFAYQGHSFVNRTYFLRGRAYNRYYTPYSYRGFTLNSYVPNRYYNSGFYSWFRLPWMVPVQFSWGWYREPWFAHFRGYFNPYPSYISPAYWLTDFILAARLADAYTELGDRPPLSGAVMLSPAVKQQIALEVERQLAVEQQEAQAIARNELPDPQAGFPHMLTDNNAHVFVVAYSLNVNDTAGRPCSLVRGDVFRMRQAPPEGAPAAYVEVIASQPGSCRVGNHVSVSIEDLQDTYNNMRESIAEGLEDLRSRAGQQGVPPLPSGLAAPPRSASFVSAAPPPESGIAEQLSAEVQAADRIEQETVAEAVQAEQNPAEAASTITITLGLTPEQVIQLLGSPKQVVTLGNKQIFIYPQMKITFLGGRVTDVE